MYTVSLPAGLQIAPTVFKLQKTNIIFKMKIQMTDQDF